MKKNKLFFCILIIISFFIISCLKQSQENELVTDEPSIDELEIIIREAERQGNVSARTYVNQFWQLADLYLQIEDYVNAYDIIIRGLRLDSWNYKYQQIASNIEIMNQEYELAYNRLTFILNNLNEWDSIYIESLAQIENIQIKSPERILVSLPGYYMYLAAYPNVNSDVVELAAARISEEYGIEVRIISADFQESEINIRDKQLDSYNKALHDVFLRYSGEVIDSFLSQSGLTQEDLNTREGKRSFLFEIYNQTEQGRYQWDAIELIRNQYSAYALQAQLTENFFYYIHAPFSLGVLGITSNDIYENDYNFLFGWTRFRLGIMSYDRFISDNPTKEQFEKRTVMQALSSAGFMIGIPRCTSPDCARAYPNSLQEQDRKDDKLCYECIENLEKRYLIIQQ